MGSHRQPSTLFQTGITNHSTEVSTSLIAYQCVSCTHVQSESRLVPYYKDVISTASLSPAILDKRDNVIRRISELLEDENPNIIEIGAFQGQYLSHLKSIGYTNVFGIENSRESVETGRLLGLNLIQGYVLDDTPILTELPSADIILCFNFLEHIPDPFQFLQMIKHKLCSASAYLYMTMPSFEYIRRTNLLQEFVPDHISYFTVQSLRTLFRRCNFEILTINEINNSNDLEIIAKSISHKSLALDQQPLLNLIRKIDLTLSEAPITKKRVAFWGAGHRSLTLISQLKHQYINYIVDSARFKQGLICPDTHIPIISPDDFFKQPTEILFLSLPGIYAEEVCKQVKNSNTYIEHLFIIDGNELTSVNLSAIS